VLVCHCRRVSDTQISSAISDGHVETRAVVRATTAGTGCGGCVNHLREVIERALGPAAVPA
jgi:bacterioferritin-associated ferredoxin